MQRNTEEIRQQDHNCITLQLYPVKIMSHFCWDEPALCCPCCRHPFPALSVFVLSFLFLCRVQTSRSSYSPEDSDAAPPSPPHVHFLTLWMRKGYQWLFICAWTSHDSVQLHTGEGGWLHNGRSFLCALVLNCEGVRLGNRPLRRCMLLVASLLSSVEEQAAGISVCVDECVRMCQRVSV